MARRPPNEKTAKLQQDKSVLRKKISHLENERSTLRARLEALEKRVSNQGTRPEITTHPSSGQDWWKNLSISLILMLVGILVAMLWPIISPNGTLSANTQAISRLEDWRNEHEADREELTTLTVEMLQAVLETAPSEIKVKLVNDLPEEIVRRLDPVSFSRMPASRSWAPTNSGNEPEPKPKSSSDD